MSVRFTKKDSAIHCGACPACAAECEPITPAVACVGHRCDNHEAVPPVNELGPDRSECAVCVADTLVTAYEEAYEKKVFDPIVRSARDRLNLLAPGAGDSFVDEARAILNAASLGD